MVIEQPVNTPEAWSERARSITLPWLACGWSEEGQWDRHTGIVDELDPQPGERLLDFGCGTGELCEIVLDDVDYVGFDPSVGMVTRARRDHQGTSRAFTAVHPTGRFDLVACVGCFNLADGWSKERTWHTIRHLWDTTGCRALAASLYAGTDERCLRYTEDELAQVGRQLSHDVRVEQLRVNDLMLVARR